jgi:hypothetical protein
VSENIADEIKRLLEFDMEDETLVVMRGHLDGPVARLHVVEKLYRGVAAVVIFPDGDMLSMDWVTFVRFYVRADFKIRPQTPIRSRSETGVGTAYSDDIR